MNKLLLLILFTVWMNNIYSQSTSPKIVSTAGETFQGTSLQIDWTLGEVAITTILNSTQQITQGFHQPYSILTDVDELPQEIGQINVFPNPTSDWLELNFFFNQTKEVYIRLYDNHGKLILKKYYKGQFISESISLSELPNGNYFLNILIDESQFSQTVKIQKLK